MTDPILGDRESSFDDFTAELAQAGVANEVEVHRATSRSVAATWNRPIRFLWIDGDHTYAGAKLDFDLFFPYLVQGAIVGLHDTLHEFEGPIRVFVEQMLRSDKFGPAGILHSVGWAQFCPQDGAKFRQQRQRLARRAEQLIPLVKDGRTVEGLTKWRWKLQCALTPHQIISPDECQRSLFVTNP